LRLAILVGKFLVGQPIMAAAGFQPASCLRSPLRGAGSERAGAKSS
jgi:hypothetical protein